jgi:outer membrane lipoprotein-sorting protein
MNKKLVMKISFILLIAMGNCWGEGDTPVSCKQSGGKETDKVDEILKRLKDETFKLKTYQCQIEHKFSQPLFESESLRKGVLYYQNFDGKSALRINFQTLKQDDGEEQKYIEQYIFDGVWLTQIDYQIKEIKRFQQAEPDKPINAFDLMSRNFPIIGFAKVEELKTDFEIKLVEQEENRKNGFIQINLKTRPDSAYKDEYKSIDFWIDEKIYLPVKIVTNSVEGDIYQIKLQNPLINEKIGKKVFEFKIPVGFGKPEIIPLKKKADKS